MTLASPFTALVATAGTAAKSAGQSIGLYAFAGLIGVVGAGFLLAAVYIWLAAELSPLTAALTMGIIMLLIAAIIVASMAIKSQRARERRRSSAASAAMLASSLSLANVGLRLVSRAKGPMFLPAAATLLAAWYFGKGMSKDD